MGLKLCVICKENETARLMDNGWGELLPVCTDCLRLGRWRELLPAPVKAPEPEPEPTPEPPSEVTESPQDVVNKLACPDCGRECKSLSGLKSHMKTHK